jgi:polar amino acid transport system substrate-binding protein
VSQAPADIVKELAPTGTLRVALNLGNIVLVQTDEKTGKQKGITIDLASELAKRLGVPLEFTCYDGAGKAFEALRGNRHDIAFLANEPARAAEIAFTAPYVNIEGVYLVRNDSPLQSVAEVDRAGIRIVVGKASAYDLFLTRTLKAATLVRGEGGASKVFEQENLEVLAGVKQIIMKYHQAHPETRIIPGRFMEIQQAMATQVGRPAGSRYLRAFVEELKANGFCADALKRSNQDAAVAPAAAI